MKRRALAAAAIPDSNEDNDQAEYARLGEPGGAAARGAPQRPLSEVVARIQTCFDLAYGVLDLNHCALRDEDLEAAWRAFRAARGRDASGDIWCVKLDHNFLRTYPAWLVREFADTLRVLDLQCNCLRAPLDGLRLAALPRLEMLSLAHNAIEALPAELSAGAAAHPLRALNLAHNRLTDASAVCARDDCGVRVLKLEHNALCALPARLGALRELVSLDVSGNSRIESIPRSAETLSAHLYRADIAGTGAGRAFVPRPVRREGVRERGPVAILRWLAGRTVQELHPPRKARSSVARYESQRGGGNGGGVAFAAEAAGTRAVSGGGDGSRRDNGDQGRDEDAEEKAAAVAVVAAEDDNNDNDDVDDDADAADDHGDVVLGNAADHGSTANDACTRDDWHRERCGPASTRVASATPAQRPRLHDTVNDRNNIDNGNNNGNDGNGNDVDDDDNGHATQTSRRSVARIERDADADARIHDVDSLADDDTTEFVFISRRWRQRHRGDRRRRRRREEQ